MARYVKRRRDIKKRKREHRLNELKKLLRQLLILGLVVLLLLGALSAATRNWPPLVVVESGSMQRGPGESSLGRIDTGDIVLVSKVDSPREIKSYVAGRAAGYSTYGDYGDVIVYRSLCLDGRTPGGTADYKNR